jgi:hypothetical protein
MLGETETQVGEVFARMPVDEQSHSDEHRQRIKNIYAPFMALAITFSPQGEIDHSID